jgi:hypothetical protein
MGSHNLNYVTIAAVGHTFSQCRAEPTCRTSSAQCGKQTATHSEGCCLSLSEESRPQLRLPENHTVPTQGVLSVRRTGSVADTRQTDALTHHFCQNYQRCVVPQWSCNSSEAHCFCQRQEKLECEGGQRNRLSPERAGASHCSEHL